MEEDGAIAAALRRSTRASSRRRPRSAAQEQAKRKRPASEARKENLLALTLRHPRSVKMQDVSIGLQRLPAHSLGGGTKENYGRGSGKTWNAQQSVLAGVAAGGQSENLPTAPPSGELMEITPPASQEEEEEVAPVGPLPVLSWANSRDLWADMRAKDVCKTSPDQELRSRHPGILPTMRTILLDWLMEVSEEYKLHRETYYLAIDLHDRFLDTWRAIQKEHLQAIGITCLFLASKIEEIYPPKVSEFAFVTDGACCVADILDMELLICKALNWRLNHNMVTVNTWVNVYMQISSHHLRPPGVKTREFEYPAYSPLEFIRVLQLLDICTLDLSSRTFSSSVLAASALYLASERSRQHFTPITGLSLEDVNDCVVWMYPFAVVILPRDGPIAQRSFPGVIPQDLHNIQTHSATIAMLDDALELRNSQQQSGVVPPPDYSVLLTPPRQERRCLAPINVSSTC